MEPRTGPRTVAEMFGLAHLVCHENVSVPTLGVAELREHMGQEVYVQWFGESDVNLGNSQFKFPVPIAVDDFHWIVEPKEFSVVLFGQAKYWPRSDPRKEILKRVGGDKNAIVLWVVTGLVKRHDQPLSFMVPMNVLLTSNTQGIIRPKPYMDTEVLNTARRAQERNVLPDDHTV